MRSLISWGRDCVAGVLHREQVEKEVVRMKKGLVIMAFAVLLPSGLLAATNQEGMNKSAQAGYESGNFVQSGKYFEQSNRTNEEYEQVLRSYKAGLEAGESAAKKYQGGTQ